MRLIDTNTKKVKDMYNSNNQNELIEKNANYFKMCVYADLNLSDAIKKLIDMGVKYVDIILSLNLALNEIPKNELNVKHLKTLELFKKWNELK